MKAKPNKDIINILKEYTATHFMDYEDFNEVYTIIEQGYIDGVLAVLTNDKSHSGNIGGREETEDTLL